MILQAIKIPQMGTIKTKINNDHNSNNNSSLKIITPILFLRMSLIKESEISHWLKIKKLSKHNNQNENQDHHLLHPPHDPSQVAAVHLIIKNGNMKASNKHKNNKIKKMNPILVMVLPQNKP